MLGSSFGLVQKRKARIEDQKICLAAIPTILLLLNECAASQCNGVTDLIADGSGTINSPNHPYGQCVSANCSWKFSYPSGAHALVLTVKYFKLFTHKQVEAPPCFGSYILTVHEENYDNTTGKIPSDEFCKIFYESKDCGSIIQKRKCETFVNTSSPVEITYEALIEHHQSNYSSEEIWGFQIDYEFVDCRTGSNHVETASETGIVSSPQHHNSTLLETSGIVHTSIQHSEALNNSMEKQSTRLTESFFSSTQIIDRSTDVTSKSDLQRNFVIIVAAIGGGVGLLLIVLIILTIICCLRLHRMKQNAVEVGQPTSNENETSTDSQNADAVGKKVSERKHSIDNGLSQILEQRDDAANITQCEQDASTNLSTFKQQKHGVVSSVEDSQANEIRDNLHGTSGMEPIIPSVNNFSPTHTYSYITLSSSGKKSTIHSTEEIVDNVLYGSTTSNEI